MHMVLPSCTDTLLHSPPGCCLLLQLLLPLAAYSVLPAELAGYCTGSASRLPTVLSKMGWKGEPGRQEATSQARLMDGQTDRQTN